MSKRNLDAAAPRILLVERSGISEGRFALPMKSTLAPTNSSVVSNNKAFLSNESQYLWRSKTCLAPCAPTGRFFQAGGHASKHQRGTCELRSGSLFYSEAGGRGKKSSILSKKKRGKNALFGDWKPRKRQQSLVGKFTDYCKLKGYI